MLQVETLKGGFDSNFSYLVYDDQSKDAALFDASVKAEKVLERVKSLGLRLRFVFLMHSHFDHLVGVQLYKQYGIPLYAHVSLPFEADVSFQHKDTLNLGKATFTVLHAPGHRFDCVLLYGDEKVFTTDVVFVGACGRCDLEGSEPKKMYDTLYHIFGDLPDQTIVYPGHDYGESPTSTVGREKKENPYLLCKSEEEFLRTRMRI